MSEPPLALTLPAEALEAIAERAAELVAGRMAREASPWMTRARAATYLGLPVSRLEKDKRIPCHRDGGRVLYHRDELDAYYRGLTSHPVTTYYQVSKSIAPATRERSGAGNRR